MDESALEREQIGKTAQDNPYLPFLIAKYLGALEPPAEPSLPDEPTGIMLARLALPNPGIRGIVPAGEGRVAAFDLIAGHFEGKRLRALPTDKGAVTQDGKIVDEGYVLLERDDGIIRVPGLVVDVFTRPWLVHKLGASIQVGQLVNRHVFIPRPLEYEYEVKDIDPSNGLAAIPRTRLY